MNNLRKKAMAQIMTSLKKEGERIMNECLNEIDYTHRTYNLHDSYGAAIYVWGEKEWSITTDQLAEEAKKWYGDMITGHQEIMDFFNEYQADKKLIELVIVAAMPYSEPLEYASSGQYKRYKVVSMAYDKLKQIQMNYGGSVETILRSKKES